MTRETIGGQNRSHVSVEGYFLGNTGDETIRKNQRQQRDPPKSLPCSITMHQSHYLQSGQQGLDGMVFLYTGEAKLETTEAEGEVTMVDA